MDLRFDAQDEAYRKEFRAWLEENRGLFESPRDPLAALEAARDLQRRLYEAGYVGLAWPKEYGGREATLTQQVIVAEELARASALPLVNTIGLSILAPTLIRHGSDEQRARFLPKILTAEELWCQGFSEPDAGSDLASLRTRAVREGDEFIVNGHKVWTSLGFIADWCFLLARTDPDAPKRQGISFLLCDMKTPGVTVQPLRNAAGGIHFSEVYFDDVRVPVGNLVGEEDGGWPIARTSLDNERSGLSGVVELGRRLQRIRNLAAETERRDGRASDDPVIGREIAQRWIELEGLRYLGYRTLSAQLHGRDPGAEAAIGKLFATEFRQRLMKTALRIEGGRAQLSKGSPYAPDRGRWVTGYLDSLAYTIGGGTSEVMRNVIAERVLHLPRSVED